MIVAEGILNGVCLLLELKQHGAAFAGQDVGDGALRELRADRLQPFEVSYDFSDRGVVGLCGRNSRRFAYADDRFEEIKHACILG